MSNRTKQAYNLLWHHLKINFPNFRPEQASCDFEEALRFSLQESFENIKITACFFHFSQVTYFIIN